jgi:predicted nucleotidyltransferase
MGDNIKMDLTEVRYKVVAWVHLAQNRDEWRALMKTAMNFLVVLNSGNFESS